MTTNTQGNIQDNVYIYTVVEYKDYRKEVDFSVIGVYLNEDEAVTYAKEQNTENREDTGQEYVGYNGEVLYDGVGDRYYARVCVCRNVLQQTRK